MKMNPKMRTIPKGNHLEISRFPIEGGGPYHGTHSPLLRSVPLLVLPSDLVLYFFPTVRARNWFGIAYFMEYSYSYQVIKMSLSTITAFQ